MKKQLTFFILSLTFLLGYSTNLAQTTEPEQPETTKTEEEETEKKPRFEAQFHYTTESLTRGLGTWRAATVYVQRRFGKQNNIVWGTFRASDRNGARDREFIGGFYKPLTKKWAVTGEAMYSPTKKFVGKFSVMGEVEKVLPKGFVAHFGGRYTSYTTVNATTGYGLVEKYWGSNRVAYTLYLTKLSNAGTAPTHRVQYNRYFGERVNTVGIAVSYGLEHENLGRNIGILRSKTWSLNGGAKYWLTNKWGISVDAGFHSQGGLYYRKGMTFGVRYRF